MCDRGTDIASSVKILNQLLNVFFHLQFESETESESEEEEGDEEVEEPTNPGDVNGDVEPAGSDIEMAPSPEMSNPPTPPPLLPKYLPALQGCRSVDDFRHLNRIEEGTYGVVFRAEDLKMSKFGRYLPE